MAASAMAIVAKGYSTWQEQEVRASAVADDNDEGKRALDRQLDAALADTFPASDPVSIVIATKSG
jgi:hypothetical protein